MTSYDLVGQRVSSAITEGIDPAYLASYSSYYASVNPWMDYWANAPSGKVRLSEEEMPARSFARSEFYVDWLSAHGGIEAAAGFREEVGPHEAIHVAWHYDLARSEQYGPTASLVLELLRPRLQEAVRTSAAIRRHVEGVMPLGPLIERVDGLAVMVDRDRRIREANTHAERAMTRSEVILGNGGLLTLRETAANRWLEDAVGRLVARAPLAETSHVFSIDERIFRVSVTLAPGRDPNGTTQQLLLPRPLVLVVINLLVGGTLQVDHAGLRFAFGLSAAEIRLCELLVNGHSLNEAATQLGLSDGTVRQRVKTVFQKTRTHRQGELIAVLTRFGRPD